MEITYLKGYLPWQPNKRVGGRRGCKNPQWFASDSRAIDLQKSADNTVFVKQWTLKPYKTPGGHPTGHVLPIRKTPACNCSSLTLPKWYLGTLDVRIILLVFPFTFSVDYKTKSGSLDDDLVSKYRFLLNILKPFLIYIHDIGCHISNRNHRNQGLVTKRPTGTAGQVAFSETLS